MTPVDHNKTYCFHKLVLNLQAPLDIQWPKCFQLQGASPPLPHCSFKKYKFNVLFILIFGTLSFPILNVGVDDVNRIFDDSRLRGRGQLLAKFDTYKIYFCVNVQEGTDPPSVDRVQLCCSLWGRRAHVIMMRKKSERFHTDWVTWLKHLYRETAAIVTQQDMTSQDAATA